MAAGDNGWTLCGVANPQRRCPCSQPTGIANVAVGGPCVESQILCGGVCTARCAWGRALSEGTLRCVHGQLFAQTCGCSGAPCIIRANVTNAALQPSMGRTGTSLNNGLNCYAQCEIDYAPFPSKLVCRQGGFSPQTRTRVGTGMPLATATVWDQKELITARA